MGKLELLLENTGDMALKRRAKNIICGLEIDGSDKILDIGCGDGYYLHLIRNISGKVKLTGTDFDESGLKRARKNLPRNIPLKQGDLMKRLPFAASTFDKAVMSEVAEHLPDDVKGLKEVHRILKKGGVLCLTVPCINYPFLWDPINWILQRVDKPVRKGFFAGIWNQHERLYSKKEIEKVVRKAGFTIEESKCLTFWSLPFNHYIVNIVARLLASNSLPSNAAASLSKYTKEPNRPWYLNLAFGFVNALDRLNDIWSPGSSGVSVFVKARKHK